MAGQGRLVVARVHTQVLPLLFVLALCLACHGEVETPLISSVFRGAIPQSETVSFDGREVHEYDLGLLLPGQGVHVVLEQRGIDVTAQVIDRQGRVRLEIDSPTGSFGPEDVCFVADAQDVYRLRVQPLGVSPQGAYGIRLRESAPPSKSRRIRLCASGRRAFDEAERRRRETSAEVAALYDEAAHLWLQSELPFARAIALKQGGSLAFWMGELDRALDFYSDALGLLDDLGKAGDPRQIPLILNLQGQAHGLAGDALRAKTLYEEAQSMAEASRDDESLLVSLSNLAYWEEAVGDLRQAEKLHREVLELSRQLGLRAREATALTELATVLGRLGSFGSARDALEDALAIHQEHGEREVFLGYTWQGIGWIEVLAGRPELAVQPFERAVEIYRRSGSALDVAGGLDRLGSAYRDLGQLEKARKAYEESLASYRNSDDRIHTAHSAANLGCLLDDLDLLQEAETTFVATFNDDALAHVRYCQAKAHMAQGDLQRALRKMEASRELVESLRAKALRHGYYIPSLRLWRTYAELHVDILVRLHERDPEGQHLDRAFELSDLAKARTLYETLLEAQVDVRAGAPEELLDTERELQHQLNLMERRRYQLAEHGRDPESMASVERTLRQTLGRLEDLRARIRTLSPRFAELREPTPVRLQDVQAALDANTLLLSYVLGDERSFLFVVDSDQRHSARAAPTGTARPIGLESLRRVETQPSNPCWSVSSKCRSGSSPKPFWGRSKVASKGQRLLVDRGRQAALCSVLRVVFEILWQRIQQPPSSNNTTYRAFAVGFGGPRPAAAVRRTSCSRQRIGCPGPPGLHPR